MQYNSDNEIIKKDAKIVFAHRFLDKDKKSEIKAFQEILEGATLKTLI